MGGKFATIERTEADGFLLSEPAPQHWDGTAQAAQDILDQAGYGDEVVVDGRADETVIYVDTSEADAADVLRPGNGLTAEEQSEAIRARAENLLDRSRLSRLKATQGSFTPELAAMKRQEIIDLVTRIDEFDAQSRWADGNMLAIKRSHTFDEEQVGRSGKYVERVSAGYDYQERSGNRFVVQQTLTAGLPPFTPETLEQYQPEIGEFLAERYGAEITMDLKSGMFTAESEIESHGAATGDRVEELINTRAAATNMRDAGTQDEFADEELFAYLQSHEKLEAADISAARDDWAQVERVGERVHDLGDRMRPADWAVALQATAPHLENKASTKSVRDFVNRGQVDDRLAGQLQQLARDENATAEFRDVARQLADRLLERPLIDRPAPAWG